MALPDPSEPPPARVAPLVLPRWVQLVLLPLAILGAVAIMRAAGPVLLLFIVAGLIALLLNPSVALLRRVGVPRGGALVTGGGGGGAVVGGGGGGVPNPGGGPGV